MHKITFVLISISVIIGTSQQEKFINPVCDDKDFDSPCCLQVAQLLALTSASTYAAAQSCASSYAAVSAATKTIVAGTTAACAGSQTSVAQTVSLAHKPDSCCGLSAVVGSRVGTYSYAISNATAEAKASAEACAEAASQAEASAKAASEAYAYAQSILNSRPGSNNGSCCTFADEILSSVTIVGKFVSDSYSLAAAAVRISVEASALAQACSNAQSAVETSTSSFLKGSIDNCCVEKRLSKCANDTANAFLPVTTSARNVHGLCLDWLAAFSSYVSDESIFTISETLVDQACSDDCAHVPIKCCQTNDDCCGEPKQSVCLATKNVAAVSLKTVAITKATADAVGYTKAFVTTLADVITSANTAVSAASLTTLSLSLKRNGCCGFSVTVRGAAASYAKTIQNALAKVNTAAEAYASGFATSNSVSIAVADAQASASTLSEAYGDCLQCCGSGCCLKLDRYPTKSFDCCQYTQKITESCSAARSESASAAAANAISFSKSIGHSTSILKQSSNAGVIEVAGMSYSYTLKCCCCTTKPNIQSAQGGKLAAPVVVPAGSEPLNSLNGQKKTY